MEGRDTVVQHAEDVEVAGDADERLVVCLPPGEPLSAEVNPEVLPGVDGVLAGRQKEGFVPLLDERFKEREHHLLTAAHRVEVRVIDAYATTAHNVRLAHDFVVMQIVCRWGSSPSRS